MASWLVIVGGNRSDVISAVLTIEGDGNIILSRLKRDEIGSLQIVMGNPVGDVM